MKSKPHTSHEQVIVEELRRDPEFAAEYLKAALEDTEAPAALLVALRHLAMAHGMAKIARKAGIERESLYRVFSAKGNPRLSTLMAVISALGVSLTLKDAA